MEKPYADLHGTEGIEFHDGCFFILLSGVCAAIGWNLNNKSRQIVNGAACLLPVCVQPVSDFCRDGCVMEGTSDVRKRKREKDDGGGIRSSFDELMVSVNVD
jgi:hypothetical protein